MTEPWIHLGMRVRAELSARDSAGDVLRSICRAVEHRAESGGLEWRVLAAFNEAFNNIVAHAYAPGQVGEACIDVTVDAARLVLELRDDGCGFDYDARSKQALPAVDTLDAGGMGLFIVRKAMSSVTYERGAPNRLRMVRDLRAESCVRDLKDDEASR